MIIFPTAKINLGLQVKGKRMDGYHELKTVFYPVPLFDVFEFRVNEKSTSINLNTYGIPLPGKKSENLVIRAYERIREKYCFPGIDACLLKNIPPGAGLGGGSSDAAFFINALNERFTLGFTPEQLKETALDIGSDCPFFIANLPALINGRGEQIIPIKISLKKMSLVLVFSGIHISTKEAFEMITFNKNEKSPDEILKQPLESWPKELINDFEAPIFKIHPVLKDIKQSLYKMGADYASMTGTGSAIYGLFSNKPALNKYLLQYNVRIIEL